MASERLRRLHDRRFLVGRGRLVRRRTRSWTARFGGANAWRSHLQSWLPVERCSIVDLGCGTGSLSVLMSELGHDVLGVDFSPKMVEKATSKGGGTSTRFEVGDAQSPELPDAAFDVVVARHVLWTLSDPVVALGRWANLVKPAGRMILIEGRWFDSSGSAYPDEVADRLPWNGGVAAETLAREVARLFDQVHVLDLADSPQLWGRSVSDERYVVIASDPPLGGD